jgi:hypothetical protein
LKTVLAAGAWAAAAAVHAACPPAAADGVPLATGPVSLAWRAEPAAIVQGQPFALLLTVCPVQAVLTAVDATMPEHRHGMNYRPSLHALGEGRWRADGLLWHMSGRWELRFEVRHEGRAQTLCQDVVLP